MSNMASKLLSMMNLHPNKDELYKKTHKTRVNPRKGMTTKELEEEGEILRPAPWIQRTQQ
jgi:hypothetical protein